MYAVDPKLIELYNLNYRQVIRITFKGKRENFIIDESRVIQGGLTLDRYSVSGSKIEIASAVAAELTLKLKNDDGIYDNTNFEGAELFVEIGIKKWDAHRWERAEVVYIPCGYFIVDTPPRTLSTITVSALDRMVLFDKVVDWSKITFPITVENLIKKVCAICGVSIQTDLSKLVNHSYVIHSAPTSEGLTYRKLIQWCAFLSATNAYMDYNGKLVFQWYEQADYQVTPAQRYQSDMYENDITITGLVYKALNGETTVVGDRDYTLSYDSCELLQENVTPTLTNIYLAIRNFTYRPYTATIKSAPFLYPMDIIKYTDAKGVVHDTIVTHVTFVVNRSTTIAGSGETSTSNDYATSSGLTAAQSQAIQEAKNNIEVTFSESQLASLNVSQLIANMMGYNMSIISDGDSRHYYIHNGNTLAGSNVIYTLRDGHFSFTDDWNNGSPVWVTNSDETNNVIHLLLKKYKITGDEVSDYAIDEKHLSTAYLNKVELAIGTALTSAKTYTDEQMRQAISEAVKDFMTSTDINNLSRLVFIQDEEGTEYAGRLKVVNGKPVFEYDTTEGGK